MSDRQAGGQRKSVTTEARTRLNMALDSWVHAITAWLSKLWHHTKECGRRGLFCSRKFSQRSQKKTSRSKMDDDRRRHDALPAEIEPAAQAVAAAAVVAEADGLVTVRLAGKMEKQQTNGGLLSFLSRAPATYVEVPQYGIHLSSASEARPLPRLLGDGFGRSHSIFFFNTHTHTRKW